MKAAVMCFLPMVLATAVALATITGNDNCVRKCGNMSVHFPFGLEDSCARNPNHVLICDHATGILYLREKISVYDISVENGTMSIGLQHSVDCYDDSGVRLEDSNPSKPITVGEGSYYTLSDTHNKLTVMGCDTLGWISNTEGSSLSGCFSYCQDYNINC